jgi:hypothetical protein
VVKRTRPHRSFALVILALGLAGCASGGSRITPASAPLQSGSGPAPAQSTARFSLTIPAAGSTAAVHRRLPAYVSSSTLSASLQVNGGASTGVDLSANSPNCTAVPGGRACIITAVAPVGSDTFKLLLYSGPLISGSPTGSLLSGASNFGAMIAEGSANVTVPLVLGGLPASVNLTAPGLVGRTPATVPMIVTAYDASGNTIIGPAPFIDATGSPATLTLALATSTSQFTLHDGAQSSTSISVAGPTDAVTLQLNAPGDALGAAFTVENSASSYLLPTISGGQKIAVNGTLASTLLTAASIGEQPDYSYFAPIDSRITTGVPSGFAFSIGSEGGGIELGYFDAATENIAACIYSSANNLAVTPVTGGLAFAFNGTFNVDTPPYGVTFVPVANLNGSTCSGTSYVTSSAADSPAHATSLVFDPSPGRLYEGETDKSFRTDSFSSPAFSNNATIAAGYAAPIKSLVALNDRQFFLDAAADVIYTQQGVGAPTTITAAGSSLTSLALVEEESAAYALDVLQKCVWVYSPITGSAVQYTPANSFTGSLSNQQWNLAIGPDGRAYATDANSTIWAVTTGGTQTTLTIPPPGGATGYLRAIFDGHNGYLYAYYDDGTNAGSQYFYRISN